MGWRKKYVTRRACKFALLAAAQVVAVGALRAQLPGGTRLNCSDPTMAATSFCRGSSDATGQINPLPTSNIDQPTSLPSPSVGQQVYVDNAGTTNTRRPTEQNPDLFPPDPVTDLQKLARSASGEWLPIFGRDMFQRAPSTFAPADQIPAMQDYVVGPGDEILLRLWGPESFNSQLTVDASGSIYVPKVGAIRVAGYRFQDLQKQVSSVINHVYRNYDLSVNLGHLHSIQVYVVGEARRPGSYTISSLSTVLNALFVSGGPNVQGSMRHIVIRREGMAPVEFDLYDLVRRGDKSHDIRLQQGDTIFIPAAASQVALGGSVRHPAIYELKDETTVQGLLELAGGFAPTASKGQLSVDRIDPNNVRRTLAINLDAAGQAMALRDGDVLFVSHISSGYEQTVTIRGNLANPGRFPWHEGMRLNDIIPDRKSLLTSGYWRERNRLGVPVPLFEPMDRGQGRTGTQNNFDGSLDSNAYGDPLDRSNQNDQYQNGQNRNGQNQNGPSIADGETQVLPPVQTGSSPSFLDGRDRNTSQPNQPNTSGGNTDLTLAASSQSSQQTGALQSNYARRAPQININIPTQEIAWSYAVIERLDPDTLRSSLVPFNLGRLVQEHDASQNLVLQPGDIVTILSQGDVHVPQDLQTKYVRLEGEVPGAGVYSVGPNETLDELVQRAGGFTPKAYLYGSSFLRESARIFQQQRLDEYISTLSTDMERSSAVRAASSNSGVLDPNALLEQRSLIAQLRQLRATGRIVLEFKPDSIDVSSVPKIPLENGDVFRIPVRPNTVSVVGSVYAQNVFLYNSERHVGDYVSLAGKPNRIADSKHAFIIRADGSIFSRGQAKGIFTNDFEGLRINPGDAIVIPEKLIRPTFLRQLTDYSQILSSFGLAAAAINVIR